MITIYDRNGGDISGAGLWAALQIEWVSPMIISLVGGGGKTSLMDQLAKELAAMGKRVVVTTSTHIGVNRRYPLCLIGEKMELAGLLWSYPVVIAKEMAGKHKLKGISLQQIKQLADYADVVLVEADGAKQLPFKVPAAHEPVVAPESSMVIACVGLDSIGAPMKEKCFRYEIACGLLGKDPDDLIEGQDIGVVLTSEKGSKKGVGEIPYRMILNKADTEKRVEQGSKILKQLKNEMGIMTSFRSRYESLS